MSSNGTVFGKNIQEKNILSANHLYADYRYYWQREGALKRAFPFILFNAIVCS